VLVLLDVQSSGALQPGGLITEGTAGSTGVSLAMVGACQWRPQLQTFKTGGMSVVLLVNVALIHSVASAVHRHTSASIAGLPWQWVALLGDAGS